MKSRVHPKYKTRYRVTNWASYDRALVRRGDVTVWLSPEAIAAREPANVGKRGGQWRYSEVAIETALTLRLIFHLPLRQTEGFLRSLVSLMGLDLARPIQLLGRGRSRLMAGVSRAVERVDAGRHRPDSSPANDARWSGEPPSGRLH